MDAITLLIADHNRVRGLFAQFEDAKEAENVETMASVGATIATELDVHTRIEEEIFYPWAKGLGDEIVEMIDEGYEEHHVVKGLLHEIAGLEPGDDQWRAKLTVVIENVEHHAEEEEKEMFPKIRGASDVDARHDIGNQLETRKKGLGAPVLADKIDLTDETLHALATEQKIPGRSKMNHEELAATVAPPS